MLASENLLLWRRSTQAPSAAAEGCCLEAPRLARGCFAAGKTTSRSEFLGRRRDQMFSRGSIQPRSPARTVNTSFVERRCRNESVRHDREQSYRKPIDDESDAP